MSGFWSRRRFLGSLVAGASVGRLDLSGWLGERFGSVKAVGSAAGGVGDFAFFHLSDSHLEPRPAGEVFNAEGRSVGVLDWFCRQTAEPIRMSVYPEAGALPGSFAIHTGDIFEYSTVDDCWADWARVLDASACEIYGVAGNHDNTWGSINPELQARYGGDSYSFDHGGCHFVCLNSSGSLSPLPCWDERTLVWLAEDLAGVDERTPVFLAMHHPLSGNSGYASEFDKLRLWEVIRRHHVVLMMDGHWHTVHVRQWQNLHRVNGGETFRNNSGYGMVSVVGGVLRCGYRFHASAGRPVRAFDGERMVAVLEKPVAKVSPRVDFSVEHRMEPGSGMIGLRVEIDSCQGMSAGDSPAEVAGDLGVRAWVDDDEAAAVALVVASDASATGEPVFVGRLAGGSLVAGRHYLTVDVASKTQTQVTDSGREPVANRRGVAFTVAASMGDWRADTVRVGSGVKAPLRLSDRASLLCFAGTDGRVRVWDWERERSLLDVATGREILHGLALTRAVGGSEVLLVGTAGGPGEAGGALSAYRLAGGDEGTELWRRPLPSAVYAPAVVREGVAYFGDGDGVMWAVRVDDGGVLWSSDVATYGVEAAVAMDPAGDRMYVGAWDGFLYGVSVEDGRRLWRSWCPRGQVDRQSRYYGPADCSPVLLTGVDGETRVYCADRGYRLGWYSRDGVFGGEVMAEVSAISGTVSGDGLYARGLDDRLLRLDAQGGVVWESAVPTGRIPNPAVAVADVVGVVSDRGLLTVLSSETGEVVMRYSVSPSLYVMASLAASADGRAWYAAGMDGAVTRLRRA
ncbi:PQQ-binding-like beta-propeller repeat protein [Mucisphaera sp.]|uniref:outer membrane protein assembly factor BamB family protein n=1 Tax=Mucisphaera sp. TaxID=2913024 RepID=UPI003D11C01D